jgi:hypothetical protein
MSSCNVKVICRFRALNEIEKRKKEQTSHTNFDIKIAQSKRVDIKLDKTSSNFSFDNVYEEKSTQVHPIILHFE